MKQDAEKNFNFLLAASATHTGLVRKANEDSMIEFVAAGMRVFAVCDGMGGHVGGQVASQTAVAAIKDYFESHISPHPAEMIAGAMMAANGAILERVGRQPELEGMGATCVMLVVTSDGRAWYGHAGDSRLYIIANHRIAQLTTDHSMVQELFDAGVIRTREDMERHPRKNEITNALGLAGMKPSVCSDPLEPQSGNCFVLCSDGLTNMVNDRQIERVVSRHAVPITQRAVKLVEMANANGGIDNITVQLVEFAVGADEISPAAPVANGHKMKYILPVLIALLLLGGVLWWRTGCDSVDHVNGDGTETVGQSLDSIFIAKPVAYIEPGMEVTTEITGLPDTDTLDVRTVKTEAAVAVKGINGRYINLEYRSEPAADSIVINCSTVDAKQCTIIIPVSKPKAAPVGATPAADNRTAEAKTHKFEVPVTVEKDGDSYKGKLSLAGLKIGRSNWVTGEITVSSQAVKADMVDRKGNMVLEWLNAGEFPGSVNITCRTSAGQVWIITVPLKLKEEEKTGGNGDASTGNGETVNAELPLA